MRTLWLWMLMVGLAALLLVSTGHADPHGPTVDTLVPVQHHDGHSLDLRVVPTRNLDARVWTEGGHRDRFEPGDHVRVLFEVSDDAYVCVYNIDTEGQLRVLYPDHPDDDGFVRGGRVMSLPPSYADVDYVVEGPRGIEYVGVVASRRPLRLPWLDGASSVSAYYDDHDDDGYYDESFSIDAAYDDYSLELAWTDEGYWIDGDPFVAMRHVQRWLVPVSAERHVATDYARLYVGGRYRYPRYACNDCHGRTHLYEPYRDRCSVFSIQINPRWRYYRRPVHVVTYEPHYVYVRHRHVPRAYRAVKRRWPAHERRVVHHRFRERLVEPKHHKKNQKTYRGYDWKHDDRRSRSYSTAPAKTKRGYTWKGDTRSRHREGERSNKGSPRVTRGGPNRDDAKVREHSERRRDAGKVKEHRSSRRSKEAKVSGEKRGSSRKSKAKVSSEKRGSSGKSKAKAPSKRGGKPSKVKSKSSEKSKELARHSSKGR